MTTNEKIVLAAFRAVEQRDTAGLHALYHPDVEFHWPLSLPYGGSTRGRDALVPDGHPTWRSTWDPLQRSDAERRMDPRVVASAGSEVVVLYRQRAVDSEGRQLDAPCLGLYEVRDALFARAQMFYFDTAELVAFLARAQAKGQRAM